MPDTASPLKVIKEYFGLTLQEMKSEWSKGALTEEDKEQIVVGLRDGTLTY